MAKGCHFCKKKTVVGILEHEIYLTAVSGNKAVEKCKKYDLFLKKQQLTTIVYLSFLEVLPRNPVMSKIHSAAVN